MLQTHSKYRERIAKFIRFRSFRNLKSHFLIKYECIEVLFVYINIAYFVFVNG